MLAPKQRKRKEALKPQRRLRQLRELRPSVDRSARARSAVAGNRSIAVLSDQYRACSAKSGASRVATMADSPAPTVIRTLRCRVCREADLRLEAGVGDDNQV